ncbi:hypothetical protein Tco_1439748 [Tanacetum coccineum]
MGTDLTIRLRHKMSRSGSLVWQGSAINRVLRTLIPFRGRFLVRGGFVTSVSLLPGRASAGLGLVSAHHILAASICLIGPGAHCDNMVLLDSGSATLPCSLCLPWSSVLLRPLHVWVDEAWLTCTITDIKCVLSQRAFGVFCKKFHIPEEVHPVLPDRDSTMHERPAKKIGLYTRFFDFANFRLPLSTFLVDILRDPALKATDFSAQDYAILVDHPSPFWKFPKEFLCLVGLSRHYTLDEETYPSFLDRDGEDMDTFPFIRTPDPTKVKVVEQERHGCWSGTQVEQGDFVSDGDGRDTDVQPIATAADTISENVVPLQPSRHKKRKTIVVNTGGPSHPPKKLRKDYETPGGPSIAGKSRSAVQRLLAGAVLNAETVNAPQRFVISPNSSHHSGANIAEAEVDSFARPSVPILTVATTVTLTSGPAANVQEKTIKPSVFAADSSSAGGDLNASVFSDLIESNFLISGIRIVIDPEFDLQRVYVPRWSVTNGSRLDDGRSDPPGFFEPEVRMRAEYNIKEKRKLKTVVNEQADLLKVREGEIDSLRAQLLLKEAEAAEAIRLRVEASSFAATEKSLRDEVNALNGRNLILEKERDALDVKNDNLANQVHELETSFVGLQEKVMTYENCMEQLEKFQDERMKIVSDKLEKLDTDLVEMALHLDEKLYPHFLTVIVGCMWLLTHVMELATVKCLHSPGYLSALGEAISKAIKKGMQDGLAAGITHGQEGRVLTDVAAYNPSAEADYIFALQQLQSSLCRKVRFDGCRLPLDQLRVPIHHAPDPVRSWCFCLSLSVDVSVPDYAITTAITTALSVTSTSASLIYPIYMDDYEVAHAAGQEGVGADANPFPDDAQLNIQ